MFVNETPMRRAKAIRLHEQRLKRMEDEIGMTAKEARRLLKHGHIQETYEVCMLLMEEFMLQSLRESPP